ncbi:MAG TPA: hypothetical protein VF263_22870, partial [Longimicrobiaceae bacterium]
SYPFHPTLHGCHPPRLLRELAARGLPYAHDAAVLYRGGPRDEHLAQVARVEQARMKVCLRLRDEVDVLICNLTILDRLSHFWWGETEPDSGVDDPDTALWRGYEIVDGFLGRVLDDLGPDDHLLVFSEIGFGPLREYVSLDDVLTASGLQRRRPDGGIDYGATLAYEAVQGSHGINLNLARRHPGAPVSPADEAGVLAEVAEALRAAVHPVTGAPLIASVTPGHRFYSGSRSWAAPDLVVEPHDEAYLPLGEPRWAERVHRRRQTGWHRRESFWAAHGPAFRTGRGGTAECADVAHTLASLLGVAPPPYPGRPLAQSSAYDGAAS